MACTPADSLKSSLVRANRMHSWQVQQEIQGTVMYREGEGRSGGYLAEHWASQHHISNQQFT